MAVIIESTQIEYGTADDAGPIRFSQPFAATPTVVSSAGVSRPTSTGFEMGGPGGWLAIGPSFISQQTPT
jgi:hypothetical protein